MAGRAAHRAGQQGRRAQGRGVDDHVARVREDVAGRAAQRLGAGVADLDPAGLRALPGQAHHPGLGDRTLASITPERVASRYRCTLVVRPTLRARTYSLLRTILTLAVEDGLLASNPCRIRGAGRSRPATPTTVATPAQVAELADAMPERLALAVLLGAWCQLRSGEVLEVRRKDGTTDWVVVTRGVTWANGEPHVGPPKTDSGVRTVSVPPHIAPAITDHLKRHTAAGTDALPFPDRPRGNGHLNPTTFAYYVKAAVVRTSLPATFRSHWLRHTGC